jgi:thymidylate synthase
MEQYLNLVENILTEGHYKPNRTASDTISTFGQFYKIDLQEGFPLLTTKDLSGFRWKSLIYELIWYFSGEEHIRNLREKTGIWDLWADEDGNLPTAYGRFWRRYPLPEKNAQLNGEWWPEKGSETVKKAAEYYDKPEDEINQAIDRWVKEESDGRRVFDQIQYAIDTLNGDHPYRSSNSRRIIINAWHPANAAVSKLPPCHYTYVLNVQDGKLNTHLTQRSADTALGVPFNIAAYALITQVIANQTGLELGEFGHTLADAHIYCGRGDRGAWYADHLSALRDRLVDVEDRTDHRAVRDWLVSAAPPEDEPGYDHVPGLLEQLAREPLDRPRVEIADRPLDELTVDDIQLHGYRSADGLEFAVAE